MVDSDITRRESLSMLGAAGIAGLAGCSGLAGGGETGYPSETITIQIPFPQGGDTDLQSRLMVEFLQDELPVDIVATNKSEAAGAVLNTEMINDVEPDGHTLGSFFYPLITTFPQVLDDFDYDPSKLTYLAQFNQVPFVIMTGFDSEYETFDDFLDDAEEGGPLSMAVTGPVAPVAIPVLQLRDQLGFELDPVFVGGGDNLATEAQAGRVDVAANVFSTTASNYAEQRTKPLAILWEKDDELVSFYENNLDITIEDHMFITEYSDRLDNPPLLTSMNGLMGPPDLPSDVQSTIEDAALEVMTGDTGWREEMINLGAFPQPGDGDQVNQRFEEFSSQIQPYIPQLRDFAAEYS
jgi:tripartite-type tricarboxylate transporter receptor subunit TctC